MNYSINITCNNKIRILVVPVLPIKKSVFNKQLDFIRKQTLFFEQDANDLPSNENNKKRKLSFEFITKDNNNNNYLEEFQPHRCIFGVIGLLDYQDWKDNKCFGKGYRKFQELLEKYPEATTRCFVFNGDSTFDLVPRLVFFNHVNSSNDNKHNNNEHFMSLFSKEILHQIYLKIEQIKNYQIIDSPSSFLNVETHSPQKKSRISSNSSTIASSMRSSIFSLPPSPTLSSTTAFSLVDHDLIKQRTPARIQKLLADLYLLGGDLETAEEVYKTSIELAKPLYDYLWIASAEEGIACIAVLKSYFSLKDVKSGTPDNIKDSENHIETAPITETIVDLYEHIMYYYLLVDTPVPYVIYAEACLKIARFLAMAFLYGQEHIDDTVLFNIIQENKVLIRQGHIATMKDLIKCKKSKIRRFSIAKWLSKIWLIELNDASLIDQVHLMSYMSFVLSNIGYHRKAAWFISEALDKILHFIIQSDSTLINNHSDILLLLKFMCNLHGIREKKNEAYEVPNGWTTIQLDILKQCIIISESLQDDKHVIYYATLMLKNMSKHISDEEKSYYAALIHRTPSIHQLTWTNPLPDIRYKGPTVLMCLEYIPSLSWKTVYKNTYRNKVDSKEPFFYNPFLKKKKEESSVYVVKKQECQFRAILGNPFSYDIEISSIIPRTCGVKFTPILSSPITIATNETVSLKLTGTPTETGTLEIQGCQIKLKGFSETEFFAKDHSCVALDSLCNTAYSDFQTIKYLPEQECKSSQLIHVIEEQTLLNIKTTSIVDKSMTLFEGEETIFHIELENVGKVSVNYLKFSFTESNYLYADTESLLSDEERYDIGLKAATPLFSWINDGKEIDIKPGQCTELILSALGKLGCTNGEIYIEYGYSNDENGPEYIRQLHLPITISVYQHLQVSNWDFSKLGSEMITATTAKKDSVTKATLEEQLEAARYLIDPDSGSSSYFLVSFDVYNSWTVAFDIELDVYNSNQNDTLNQKLVILPGHTKRIVLPMKKLYLSPEKAVEPIPNKQQIIVSQENKSGRALFWYQQLLLKRIKARWNGNGSGRKGFLELNSLKLDSNQLNILKEQDFKFHVMMRNMKKQIGYRKFQCSIYSMITLDITIFNKHDYPVKLILRTQPSQCYDGDVRDYDLTNKLLFEGLTQLVLPEIPAKGSIVHSIPLTFISCGQYQFIQHIENIHTREILYDHDWVYVHVLAS